MTQHVAAVFHRIAVRGFSSRYFHGLSRNDGARVHRAFDQSLFSLSDQS